MFGAFPPLAFLLHVTQHEGRSYALENPREHFMHTRSGELDQLRARKTTTLKVQLVNDWLQTAITNARLINRMREESGQTPINFDHLEAWRGVLARIATPIAITGQ